jgi:alpha-N-acetylglucosaminidase
MVLCVFCYRQSAELFLKLLADLDVLLGSNEDFLLGRWLEAAKARGTTAEVNQLYILFSYKYCLLTYSTISLFHDFVWYMLPYEQGVENIWTEEG